MIAAIWKSAALAGVIGVGCGGVWYVQRDLATTTPLEPNKFSDLDPSLQGDVGPSLTGTDSIELASAAGKSPAAGRVANALPSQPKSEPQPDTLAMAIPDQAEPQSEPDADSMLALVNPQAEKSNNPWATRDSAPSEAPAAPKTAAANANSDPWGDLPGLGANTPAKAPAGRRAAVEAPQIDLVANEDESKPAAGALDNKLTALPPEHPGPVLLSVPERTASAPAGQAELFTPDFGNQTEPASGEIQQVQNQLPEIRPNRARSSIPGRADAQVVSPYYEREAGGNAEPLPAIRPAAGNATRTAIVPDATDFTPAGAQPLPTPTAEPTPAGSPASNPFDFAPAQNNAAPAPTSAPGAFPGRGADPAPGGFLPAEPEPMKAMPARSTLPGAVLTPVEEAPSKFAPAPFQPVPNPTAAPASPPASTIPGNRSAIPELQAIPLGPTPSANPTPANAAPTAAPNPFGSTAPTGPAAAPVETLPVRRDPVVDLVGDGTVGAGMSSGPQQPEIKIQKIAPAEAVIGEALIYQILVRNVGQSTAHRVIVEDRIPLGATCQGTIPQAETADKRLFWKLGDMRPGEERELKVKLTPTQAGSIGSVATVSFAAEVAATTVITAPQLKIDLQTPRQVVLGEQSTFKIRVKNDGQGTAKAVLLRALLPKELRHPGGNDLEYEIGNLGPGQSKDVDLHVSAEAVGNLTPKVIVSTNNQEQDSRTAQLSAIDTRLKIVRNGPAKRFVGRTAAYKNTVTNQSLDVLKDVNVVETVPRDLEPTGKLSNGQWDPQNRTITWRIPQIGPGEQMDLAVDLVPKKPGAFDGTLQITDATGNRANVATHVDVAGYSNLVVDVVPDGPVAVGEQVSMRLSVRNRGTAAASNVQTVFEVPPHLKFVNANGPVQHQAAGNVVHFAALDVIAPGAEQEFDIILTAAQEGDARVKVDLYSDDHKTDPLHEEGEVRVYRDAR